MGMLGKNPIELFAAGPRKVFPGQVSIIFQTGGDETVEKMSSHELIVSNAVKGIVFHPIILVEPMAWQSNIPPAPHIDTDT